MRWFLLFCVFGLFGCDTRAERDSLEARCAERRKAATTIFTTKKIINVYYNGDKLIFFMEDGTAITVWSVAHHSAGAHLDFGEDNLK